jgi:hypothetical protein
MAGGIGRLRKTYVASLSVTQEATIGGATLSRPTSTYNEGFVDGHHHGLSSAADTLRNATEMIARAQHHAVARLLREAADATAREVEAHEPPRYLDAEIKRAVLAEREACIRCLRALADGKPLRDAAMLRLAATILRRCRESGATVINASISYPTDADGRPTEE